MTNDKALEAAVERIGEAIYRRHERGFVMWPLFDGDRIKAEIRTALSTGGSNG